MQRFGPAPGYGHVQRPDREVAFHPVAVSRADPAPRTHIQHYGKIEPDFAHQGMADSSRPFLMT